MRNNRMEAVSSMNDVDLYNIALSFLPGVGDVNARKLISTFGSAEAVFKSSTADLHRMTHFGEMRAAKLYSHFNEALQRAEEELMYIYGNDINYVTFADTRYPKRLRNCDDAPAVLYYKGDIDFNTERVISVVGTRSATDYGVSFCNDFLAALAEKYPETVVVSGLAFGIDVAAHRGALKNGLTTWAVFGHSLETVYPSQHKNVAKKILDSNGGLISDFPHKSGIDAFNFVKRNRIVAGLADALIVVESGKKGGSIITADIANHYNKDVFAVPGNINAVHSAGTNNLIKTNRANLLESVADLEYIMGWTTKNKVAIQQKLAIFDDLDANEQTIVNILNKYEYLDIDNIIRQSKISFSTLSMSLLQLEFKGWISTLPGKLYALKHKR